MWPTGSYIDDHSVSTVDLVWHCCVAGMTCVRGLIEDSLGRRRNTCLWARRGTQAHVSWTRKGTQEHMFAWPGKEHNYKFAGQEKEHKQMFAGQGKETQVHVCCRVQLLYVVSGQSLPSWWLAPYLMVATLV